MAAGIDGVDFQFFLLNAFHVPGGIVHAYAVVIILLWIVPGRHIGDFQGHLIRQSHALAAGDGVLIFCRKADGFPVVKFHIIFQHIGHKAGQEVSQFSRLGAGVQHLHFVLAEHLHTIGVGAYAALVPIQAEPDPVENGQFILLHHIGKALIEPRLEHHAAGVDAGGVFLAAAGGHQLGVELATLQQIFLLAQDRHHDMGAVLLGGLDRLRPHIVVFCVQFGLAVRDRIGHQAYSGDHVAHFKDHSVVAVAPVLIFLHGDVPLCFHILNELGLVPASFGHQDKAGEGAPAILIGFFVSVIILVVIIFIHIIDRLVLQTADKLLKTVGKTGDFIVVLLIHMDHRRLSLGAAVPVVQKDHIVSCTGTVADGYADGRIFPLVDHKPAAQLSAERIVLLPANAKDASDGYMVIRPTGWFVAGIAGIGRYPAVVLFHQANIRGRQLVAQLLLHTGDQFIGGWLTDILFQSVLIIIPKVCKIKAFKGSVTGRKPGFLFPAALPVPDLLPALPDHCRGVLILRVQLRPPLGVGNGFFLLAVEILIAVGHPHIPLRLVPDGLQHLNSLQERLIPLEVGGTLLMVPNDGVVFQRPCHGIGGAIVPLVLVDRPQHRDAAGVFVLVVPPFQLPVKCLCVLRGVRDVLQIVQRFFVTKPVIFRLIPCRLLQSHCPHIPAEHMEACPGQIGFVKELLSRIQDGSQIPGDEVHIAAVETGGPAGQGNSILPSVRQQRRFQLLPEVKDFLTAVLIAQGIQRITEKARRSAVSVKIVHAATLRTHVVVDKRRAAGDAGDNIQPPISIGIFIRFHLIPSIALQKNLRVDGKVKPHPF